MAGEVTIKGHKELVRKINQLADNTFKRVVDATSLTADLVTTHARSGHDIASGGHAIGRYENQTTNLTNSIVPKPEKVDQTEVVFSVIAPMEYAAHVEYGTVRSKPYPFMFPALASQEDHFRKRIAEAAGKE